MTDKIRPGFFCEICGTPLTMEQTEPSKIARGGGKFCSKPCYGQWVSKNRAGENSPYWQGGPRTTGVKIRPGFFCEICNTPLTVRQTQPSAIALGKGKTCSRKCQSQWQTENLSGENSVHWKGGQVEVPCVFCGKKDKVYMSKLKRKNRHFCSMLHYSKGASGKNSHAWRNGKTFEVYPTAFNRRFKRIIRERDKYFCAICGVGDATHVHHINYIKDDTTPENCITLCCSCHGKTGANREYWRVLLEKIVNIKNEEQ